MILNGSTTAMVAGRFQNLKSKIVIVLAISLTGCAGAYRSPTVNELQYVPDDCLNRNTVIIPWLEKQLDNRKPITHSQKEYDDQTSAIKHKIWHLRYRCQPA